MLCEFADLPSGGVFCKRCNRDALMRSRRRCRLPDDAPAGAALARLRNSDAPADDTGKAAAWEICRSNACGHYGHVGDVEVCSIKRCRQSGRMTHTPIEGLVDGLGCPKRLWPLPPVRSDQQGVEDEPGGQRQRD